MAWSNLGETQHRSHRYLDEKINELTKQFVSCRITDRCLLDQPCSEYGLIASQTV